MTTITQKKRDRDKKSKVKKPMSFLSRFFAYLIMIVFAFMTIYPIAWLIMNSFKSTREFQVNQLGLRRGESHKEVERVEGIEPKPICHVSL